MKISGTADVSVIEGYQIVPSADATANAVMRDVVGNKSDAAQTTVETTRSIIGYVKGLLGCFGVPAGNSQANTKMNEVIGNKGDTFTVSHGPYNSLVAYAKGLIELLCAPSVDNSNASYLNYTVGNKGDSARTAITNTRSLMGYVKGILNMLHGEGATIVEDTATATPSIVSITSVATANTWSSWVEVDASVAANSWINAITVSVNCSDDANLVVELGTGAAGAEATKIRFSYRIEMLTNVGFFPTIVYPLALPIKVASGTRIAVRVSESTANSYVFKVGVQYYRGL